MNEFVHLEYTREHSINIFISKKNCFCFSRKTLPVYFKGKGSIKEQGGCGLFSQITSTRLVLTGTKLSPNDSSSVCSGIHLSYCMSFGSTPTRLPSGRV